MVKKVQKKEDSKINEKGSKIEVEVKIAETVSPNAG